MAATDKSFHLQIVTPKKASFDGLVTDVLAPGSEGGFEVLKNHAPFLASLKVGEIKICSTSGDESFFATSGGIAEVLDNTVIILAETAEPAATIDLERAEQSRQRAEQRLRERAADLDLARAEASLIRALNRINVCKRHKA